MMNWPPGKQAAFLLAMFNLETGDLKKWQFAKVLLMREKRPF